MKTLTPISSRPKTKKIVEELCQLLPYGVNSPVRSASKMGCDPLIVERGQGSLIYDVDGHEYIDYCGSWGALIHGHAHPIIMESVLKRASMGTSFGISTPIEGELAKKIIKLVPSVQKIRFVSSGTEATMSALRLARGFTKKDYIVKFSGNYHGHADFLLVQAGSGVLNLTPSSSSAGVPHEMVKYTLCLPYNDSQAVKDLFKQPEYKNKIAGIIVEPIAGNIGVVPPKDDFLKTLREVATEHNALLIIDEVITGFRVSLQGAQGLYGVNPDLTCFGKIMGGGFPAAAFGGRRDIMDFLAPQGPVYQAGTLSGNPVAIEAGLQALTLLENPGFYEELKVKTDLLTVPLQDYLKDNDVNGCIQQVGSMFTLFLGKKCVQNMKDAQELDVELYANLFRWLLQRGIYIPPLPQEAWFVSSAHTNEQMEYTKSCIFEWFQSRI